MRGLVPFACTLVVVATWLPADAGYRLVNGHGGETLLSKGRVKMMLKGGSEGGGMTFDLGQGRMWMAHARNKTYWEGTPEEFCTGLRQWSAAAVSQMQERMKDQLAKMTPEQRAQTEKLLQQQGLVPGGKPPQVTIERTGETATIAGLSARRYRILADGKPYEELWLTADANVTREVNLARAPESYARLVGCQAQGTAPASRRTVYESPEYAKVYGQGLPLKTVHYGEDGAGRTVSEVVTVESRDISEAEFAPPAGFRKVPLPEFLGSH